MDGKPQSRPILSDVGRTGRLTTLRANTPPLAQGVPNNQVNKLNKERIPNAPH